MKKVFVLLLALCFCLTAACSVEKVLQDAAESIKSGPTAEPLPSAEAVETPAEQPEEDSGTDLVMPGEEGFVDDSGTDTPPAAGAEGWTALTAEECVEDAWPTAGVLPRIVLDCQGADEINAQLDSQFVPLADDPMCEGLNYECYKSAGRVLSLLMIQRGPNDTVFYTPFNLDLATGQALTGGELLALLGADATQLANLEQAVMGEEFTHLYGTAEVQTDVNFFNEQYARTTSPENADTERIWLGDQGQLLFVGRIYGMAGAEYYEYPMGSTLFFN